MLTSIVPTQEMESNGRNRKEEGKGKPSTCILILNMFGRVVIMFFSRQLYKRFKRLVSAELQGSKIVLCSETPGSVYSGRAFQKASGSLKMTVAIGLKSRFGPCNDGE